VPLAVFLLGKSEYIVSGALVVCRSKDLQRREMALLIFVNIWNWNRIALKLLQNVSER